MTTEYNQSQRARMRPLPKLTGQVCPKCGGPLLERFGVLGKYIGCTNYPTCSYTSGGTFRPIRLTKKG
jgi:ssDNA-binding Zn-finger/Zn-ribbon topoisomerase 1